MRTQSLPVPVRATSGHVTSGSSTANMARGVLIYYYCHFEYHLCEVYSKQHYVIKCVSDLREVSSFLRVLRFLPPIKLTATI
jgi:hypothetical protein